ncbi:MAG TPA: NAD(P)H-dependent oxidoreductase [Pilimelia sp.]|nr:NAD(P)H-dependent oxidoreductase [Pilimelia sp.]
MTAPSIVLVSGSLRRGSTCDRVAQLCARYCTALGAHTRLFPGASLRFPFYEPGLADTHDGLRDFLDALAGASGVVLVSPAYHGTVSGLLKNALDFVNDLGGTRPYLDGRAVACLAVGGGSQGAASTLATLRTVSHALRGWPTPLGVVVTPPADLCEDGDAAVQCRTQMSQLLSHVYAQRADARPPLEVLQ